MRWVALFLEKGGKFETLPCETAPSMPAVEFNTNQHVFGVSKSQDAATFDWFETLCQEQSRSREDASDGACCF